MSRMIQRAPRAVVTEVFDDLRPQVDAIAGRFSRFYGRDLEETRAEAYLAFLEAYHGFSQDYDTNLEQRVDFVVWNRLLDRVRDEIERDVMLKAAGDVVLLLVGQPNPESFDRDEYEMGLTDDARTIIALLLDTPGDLVKMIQSEPPSRDCPGAPINRCLSRYLKCTMRWASGRVGRAFAELWEIVNE